MARRKTPHSAFHNLLRDIFWHMVLYFVYFSTLILWIRIIGGFGVRAQGNRGVIINNTKFDDLNTIQHLQTQQIVNSTAVISSINSKVIVFFSLSRKSVSMTIIRPEEFLFF